MKELYIIGGMDSLGVPYTKDNKEFKNHLAFVKEFIGCLGCKPHIIDMYSMAKYNTPLVLRDYVTQNIKYSEIKSNQQEGIFLCRMQGIFQYIKLSKKVINRYNKAEDSEIRLTDTIKDNDCIFIYSNCINDFFDRLNITLDKLITKKGIDETISKLHELAPLVALDIKQNIDMLKMVNPNIEIYMLGLYVPSRVDFIRNLLASSVLEVNGILKDICESYENVFFIDNMNIKKENIERVDFHFNLSGQQLVGNNINNCLKDRSEILSRQIKR